MPVFPVAVCDLLQPDGCAVCVLDPVFAGVAAVQERAEAGAVGDCDHPGDGGPDLGLCGAAGGGRVERRVPRAVGPAAAVHPGGHDWLCDRDGADWRVGGPGRAAGRPARRGDAARARLGHCAGDQRAADHERLCEHDPGPCARDCAGPGAARQAAGRQRDGVGRDGPERDHCERHWRADV